MKAIFNNKYFRVILGIEIIILFYFVVRCFLPTAEYLIPYSDMEYNNGKIIDGKGIYTDSTIGTKGYFVYGPSFHINSGVYDITINYQTECLNNYIVISGHNQDYNSVLMDDFVLNPLIDTQKFTVWINKNIRGFAVSVIYDGTEEFLIEDITIKETVGGRIYELLKALLVLTCINTIIWIGYLSITGKVKKEKLQEVLFLGGIIIFASYPLFTSFLTEGDDIVFHLLRIEGMKEGLLSGQFPVRIHPFQFRGYGYASSIFYGEILLYIPAVLRLCGFPLQTAYKVFLLLVNCVTAFVSYKSILTIVKDKKTAMICCFVYVLAPYRLTNIYVRSAVGEYCAMIFWPVIACGLYRLFTMDTDSKEYKKIWIFLTIGYTGLIQTHLLSCELAAAVSVIVCLIMIKKLFRRDTILELVKFFGMTVFLNAFYLVPFLDYMIKGGILVVDNGSLQTNAIQGNGIYPAQLFNLFVNGSGMAYGHGVDAYKVLGMSDEMGTTAGIALLTGLVVFLYMCIGYYQKIKEEKLFKTAFLMGIAGMLALIMSTNVFPWDVLCRNFGSLVYNLQFPWRMLSVGTMFLTLLLGCTLVMAKHVLEQKSYRIIVAVVIAVNVITAGFMLYDRLNTSKGMYVYDAVTFANNGSGSLNEYLPSETDAGLLNEYEPAATQNLIMTDYEKQYTNITFHVKESENIPGKVVVPLLAYEGYEAEDKSGDRLELSKDENGVLTVVIPAGYEGNVSIHYEGMWYWHAAEIISLITCCIFLYFAVKSYRRNADKNTD